MNIFSFSLIFLSFSLILSDQQPLDKWEAFKVKFNKTYEPEEESVRKKIFHKNLEYILRHNEKAEQGLYTYNLDVNEFSDMESDEFQQKYLGYKSNRNSNYDLHEPLNKELPLSIDWREKNVVAKVKDQKACGSCWAFSAVASLESALAIKNNELVELSEQNLVDCSREEGNDGCNGGYMDLGFEYIMKHGIDTEKSYPYEGRNGKCRFRNDTVGGHIRSYVDIKSGDENSLLDAVATKGPVSVAIDSTFLMQFYHHGIFYDPFCSNKNSSLNHGVTAVGYGKDKNTDYWIIKNSWGQRWGEKGYMRIKRKKNLCGIATSASYPVV